MLKSWTSILTKGGKPGNKVIIKKILTAVQKMGRKNNTEGQGPKSRRQSWLDLLVYIIIVTKFISNDLRFVSQWLSNSDTYLDSNVF